MTLRQSSLVGLTMLALTGVPALSPAISLVPMEEPLTQLATPVASGPAFSYGSQTATIVTSTPLLCGNTSAPVSPIPAIKPVYYGPAAVNSPTPLPFVFGAAPASPSLAALAYGATGIGLSGSSMSFIGDPSLICYGLSASGARRLTPDVYRDEFSGVRFDSTLQVDYNSTVTLSVFHLPASPSDYYGYSVDITIPPLPAGFGASCGNFVDCNFALLEGYDTSVFSTTVGGWCLAAAGALSCPATTLGGININYANFGGALPNLTAPIAPAAAKTFHFVVLRYFRSGVASLPVSGAPVAITALFSPFDLDENKLDDNVAAGANSLTNAAPFVVFDDAWTQFSGKLSSLSEGTDSGTLAFDISDSDTPEQAGSPLSAAVTLDLGGIQLPLVPVCVAVAGPGAANRQCTMDINLSDASLWNATVAAAYQGLFNTLATDTANGNYANGVSAAAQIVVTDSLGKASAAIVPPIHIFSTVNNKPVVSYGLPLATQTDPHNGLTYPTFTCSVGAGAAAGGCGSARSGVILIDIPASIAALPGPLAAFDELASQTTAVVPYSDPNDVFTNVQCSNEQAAAVFSPNGGPIVAPAAGSNTAFDMNFVIPGAPPSSSASVLCTLTITDQMALYPNAEAAKTVSTQFRLDVSP